MIVGDPVWIVWDRNFAAYIVEKHRWDCVVLQEDGWEGRAPWPAIRPRMGASRKRVMTQEEMAKVRLKIGDVVEFTRDGETLRGTVSHLKPTRAQVICADQGGEWEVPYLELSMIPAVDRSHRVERLLDLGAKADRLIAHHGLHGWSFQFDDAVRRAGSCLYATKVITMARLYCLQCQEEDWTNTLLHEIAHALAGPGHNHDKVWKRMARRIGCTGERCHNTPFAPPRYIVYCPRCKWARQRNQRSSRLVCRECSGRPSYETFTAERWREFGEDHRLT